MRLLLLACVGLAAPDGASPAREPNRSACQAPPTEVASEHPLYGGNAHGAAHVARGLGERFAFAVNVWSEPPSKFNIT